MAPKKKKIEEAVAPPTAHEVAVEVASEPQVFKCVLAGKMGALLTGSVNGKVFELPCGVELELDESTYHSIMEHTIKER